MDGAAGLGSLRGAVGATIAFTAVTLIGLGIGWAWLFNRTSEKSAVQDAGRYGALSGRAALAPFITDDLLLGKPDALASMDIAGTALIQEGGAAHVKVWSKDARVLWADEQLLIGRTFQFDPDEKALIGTQEVLANLSSLNKDENALELAAGETSLLQVYFGSKTPSGTPVVVETYYPASLVDSRAADQRRSFLPLLLGGLGLLTLAQLPLVRALTHRLRTLQTQRESLLQRVSPRATPSGDASPPKSTTVPYRN
jgi:two-component system, NarL family, sensor kinase